MEFQELLSDHVECRGLSTHALIPGERPRGASMELQVVIHEAEEGGYWAEVHAIPGCATQGDTFEEILQNVYEAVEACTAARGRKLRRALPDLSVKLVIPAQSIAPNTAQKA